MKVYAVIRYDWEGSDVVCVHGSRGTARDCLALKAVGLKRMSWDYYQGDPGSGRGMVVDEYKVEP